MSDRDDIEIGRLIYTCNCGWIDHEPHERSLHPQIRRLQEPLEINL